MALRTEVRRLQCVQHMVALAYAHQAERRVNGIIELDSARGQQLGFTSARFNHGSYLWDDDDRVLVSFVWSRAPGNFRALVAAIHAEGKTVAVPTPLPRMEAIVRKNGYTHAVEFDGVDVWSLPPTAAPGAAFTGEGSTLISSEPSRPPGLR
jgi:hypothetical protein